MMINVLLPPITGFIDKHKQNPPPVPICAKYDGNGNVTVTYKNTKDLQYQLPVKNRLRS